MSDEESFVILGSSPMSSLEHDGDRLDSGAADVSIHSDAPGSCFSSLQISQMTELQDARIVSNKTPTPSMTGSKELAKSSNSPLTSLTQSKEATKTPMKTSSAMNDSQEEGACAITTSTMQRSAESLLWSRPQVEVKEDFLPISLEDCALQSPLEQSPKNSMQSRPPPSPLNMSLGQSAKNSLQSRPPPSPLTMSLSHSSNKENVQPSINQAKTTNTASLQNGQAPVSASSSKNSSLASSFIMGEVNADVLKSSVYSQFPSISMQACAEDVMKLQTMFTEYVQLKTTLEKVNHTMKLFYTNSLEWKEKMNTMESHYKLQLSDCQHQIEALRIENVALKKSIDEQIEQTKAVDLARQNDREDMIKTISEKTSLVENMRAQIVKLEHRNSTFEFLPKNKMPENNFDELYITRDEHNIIVKDLKRQLSEFLASNLDIKDMEKQYIDELNCLKVNLTAAEEMINQSRAEISLLKQSDLNKLNKIEELERSNHLLVTENTIQNERIILLEQQNEVHRKDFEMERESRQTAVGEKQQILLDLRTLQKRNQDLLEERQKLVENYERRVSSMAAGGSTQSALVAAAAAAQSYMNNPQRPIREISPPSPSGQSVQPPASMAFNCPVCNKSFKSLSVLQSHVNDCIDRN